MKTISTIIDDAELTLELDATFDTIKKKLNAPFVPNFFKVWGNAPSALNGIFPAMQYILATGELDRKLKEMMIIAISSLNDCDYCESAHAAFCSMFGGSPEQITALKNINSLPNLGNIAEKAAIDFAVELAKDPDSSTEEKIGLLMALGYTKSQVMEIIATSGLAVFYNHLATATKVNLDKEFM